MIANLTKALLCVVATPVALVADLFTLPCAAYDNTPEFKRTSDLLHNVGKCFNNATKADDEKL